MAIFWAYKYANQEVKDLKTTYMFYWNWINFCCKATIASMEMHNQEKVAAATKIAQETAHEAAEALAEANEKLAYEQSEHDKAIQELADEMEARVKVWMTLQIVSCNLDPDWDHSCCIRNFTYDTSYEHLYQDTKLSLRKNPLTIFHLIHRSLVDYLFSPICGMKRQVAKNAGGARQPRSFTIGQRSPRTRIWTYKRIDGRNHWWRNWGTTSQVSFPSIQIPK